MRKWLPVCCVCLLSACATSRPDHFYILSAQPGDSSEGRNVPRKVPATAVFLNVSIPSLVDRPEMVFNTSADGVVVMEHERWAAPFADLVSAALARDIERRRADVLVAESGHGGGHAAEFNMKVDVVQVSVHPGGRASIEAQWHILNVRTGKDVTGDDMFSAPLTGDGAAAATVALSECLGLLADRLAAQLTAP